MLDREAFEIIRSPAKVCWHIMFRDTFICTAETRAAAEDRIQELRRLKV